MLHENQNEPILAERAFLEARKVLKAEEQTMQIQSEEENRNEINDKKENYEQKEETALPTSPTVIQSKVQHKEYHTSIDPAQSDTLFRCNLLARTH